MRVIVDFVCVAEDVEKAAQIVSKANGRMSRRKPCVLLDG